MDLDIALRDDENHSITGDGLHKEKILDYFLL